MTANRNFSVTEKKSTSHLVKQQSETKVLNAETQAALDELDAGKCKSFDSVEELMADLNADD